MTRQRKKIPDGRPGAQRSTRLSLAVQYACADPALPSRAQLRRWVRAALNAASATSAVNDSATVTIRFVDAEEGRALNHAYRSQAGQSRDYATNVLSFPYAPPPQLAGDLVICQPVVRREATAQDKPLRHHLAHLVIHGMLHLQGFDHESDADALRMENEERRILARFRIPDPYRAERIAH
ncbi:putative metal-dependent hydrolase [Sterolibacterium denitrificans]|uniref:Endoribonuclease YbeY n=1 Tax=Sterolibacterium denitrificans TaxID=157592 RepID=A0A7Z7HRJ8_9PROT|nr:rRNA maturation RNase YbeY [Sterolibacterium denitrificans]SMB25971.1 putative metal-dependent hydrolase [Sterolibacterium denitrificans]